MTDAPLTPDQAAMLADALDLERLGVVAVANGTMTRVHPEDRCAGQPCWIHNPTQNWSLTGRPVYYRAETRMAYRTCEHDVLHPDIDSLAWTSRGTTKYAGREIGPGDPAWHECDDCCESEEDRDGPA